MDAQRRLQRGRCASGYGCKARRHNLPYQLSKGTPGAAAGVLQNVTYIQRIKTKGGQDLSKACTQADLGDKLTRPYQADYIFWKAAWLNYLDRLARKNPRSANSGLRAFPFAFSR